MLAPAVMSLLTLSMSGAVALKPIMSHSAEGPCSLKYAAVESARTDDDASYRVRSQVKAGKRPRPGEEGVG